MPLKEMNEEVFYMEERIPMIGPSEIDFLKQKVRENVRKRARLCAHRSVEDSVHEMFVALTKESYVRPHKHLQKSESFHIIQGAMELVLFDDEGRITEAIPLADSASGGRFYHRMSEPTFHTVRILSDFLLFHETTNGPFQKSDTLFAPWAPEERDPSAVRRFMESLAR